MVGKTLIINNSRQLNLSEYGVLLLVEFSGYHGYSHCITEMTNCSSRSNRDTSFFVSMNSLDHHTSKSSHVMQPRLSFAVVIIGFIVHVRCIQHFDYFRESYGKSINDVPGIAAASASIISDTYLSGVTGVFCTNSCIAALIQEGIGY